METNPNDKRNAIIAWAVAAVLAVSLTWWLGTRADAAQTDWGPGYFKCVNDAGCPAVRLEPDGRRYRVVFRKGERIYSANFLPPRPSDGWMPIPGPKRNLEE